ncbi:MAG: hypothetical protein ACHP65_03040 [Legionellales bacterium]
MPEYDRDFKNICEKIIRTGLSAQISSLEALAYELKDQENWGQELFIKIADDGRAIKMNILEYCMSNAIIIRNQSMDKGCPINDLIRLIDILCTKKSQFNEQAMTKILLDYMTLQSYSSPKLSSMNINASLVTKLLNAGAKQYPITLIKAIIIEKMPRHKSLYCDSLTLWDSTSFMKSKSSTALFDALTKSPTVTYRDMKEVLELLLLTDPTASQGAFHRALETSMEPKRPSEVSRAASQGELYWPLDKFMRQHTIVISKYDMYFRKICENIHHSGLSGQIGALEQLANIPNNQVDWSQPFIFINRPNNQVDWSQPFAFTDEKNNYRLQSQMNILEYCMSHAVFIHEDDDARYSINSLIQFIKLCRETGQFDAVTMTTILRNYITLHDYPTSALYNPNEKAGINQRLVIELLNAGAKHYPALLINTIIIEKIFYPRHEYKPLYSHRLSLWDGMSFMNNQSSKALFAALTQSPTVTYRDIEELLELLSAHDPDAFNGRFYEALETSRKQKRPSEVSKQNNGRAASQGELQWPLDKLMRENKIVMSQYDINFRKICKNIHDSGLSGQILALEQLANIPNNQVEWSQPFIFTNKTNNYRLPSQMNILEYCISHAVFRDESHDERHSISSLIRLINICKKTGQFDAVAITTILRDYITLYDCPYNPNQKPGINSSLVIALLDAGAEQYPSLLINTIIVEKISFQYRQHEPLYSNRLSLWDQTSFMESQSSKALFNALTKSPTVTYHDIRELLGRLLSSNPTSDKSAFCIALQKCLERKSMHDTNRHNIEPLPQASSTFDLPSANNSEVSCAYLTQLLRLTYPLVDTGRLINPLRASAAPEQSTQFFELPTQSERDTFILDDALNDMYQRSAEASKHHGKTVLSLSAHEIDRVLLHAMLVPANQWSPIFNQILQLITHHLLHSDPASHNDSSALKKPYPVNFLKNLLLMSLIQSLPSASGFIKQYCIAWFNKYRLTENIVSDSMFLSLSSMFLSTDSLHSSTADFVSDILNIAKGQLGTIIDDWDKLYMLLKLPTNRLTEEHVSAILHAVKDQLGTMIDDWDKLYMLLKLPPNRLTEEHVSAILHAVKDQLGTMISNCDQLYMLLELPTDRLKECHRGLILNAVKDQLGTMISNWGQPYTPPELPSDSQKEDHDIEILNAVKDRLSTISSSENFLSKLLELSLLQLTEAHRGVIFFALKDQLGTMINDWDTLYQLFKSPYDRLTSDHKSSILLKMKDRLDMIINNWDKHYKLLQLPIEQLTEDHRLVIFHAMKYQLCTMMIYDGRTLYYLFSLPTDLMTADDKSKIWDAVEGRLGTITYDGDSLHCLLALPSNNLKSDHKSKILFALQHQLDGMQLGNMIGFTSGFHKLLALPNEILTAEHKSMILSAVQRRYGMIIWHARYIYKLLALPAENMTSDNRSQIYNAVKDRLDEVSFSSKDLCDLLALPAEKLAEDQKNHIWFAVKGRLSQIICNGADLGKLLVLSPEQLTADHRQEILFAVRDRLYAMIQEGPNLCGLLALSIDQPITGHARKISAERVGSQSAAVSKDSFFPASAQRVASDHATKPNSDADNQHQELLNSQDTQDDKLLP